MESIIQTQWTPEEHEESTFKLFQRFREQEKSESLGFINRKNLQKELSVTPQCLIKWEKAGLIQPYRLGRLIFYKREEIIESLQKVDKR